MVVNFQHLRRIIKEEIVRLREGAVADPGDPSQWKRVRPGEIPPELRAACPAIGRKVWYAGPSGFFGCEGSHEQGTDLWVRDPSAPDRPPWNPKGWCDASEIFDGHYPRPWREHAQYTGWRGR